jgi:hypothetical protein
MRTFCTIPVAAKTRTFCTTPVPQISSLLITPAGMEAYGCDLTRYFGLLFHIRSRLQNLAVTKLYLNPNLSHSFVGGSGHAKSATAHKAFKCTLQSGHEEAVSHWWSVTRRVCAECPPFSADRDCAACPQNKRRRQAKISISYNVLCRNTVREPEKPHVFAYHLRCDSYILCSLLA